VVIVLVEDSNRKLYPVSKVLITLSMNLWAFERRPTGVDDTKRRYKTRLFVHRIVDYCRVITYWADG